MLSPWMLKTAGYLISTVSVILLAVVAWPKAKDSALLAACLIGGVVASIIGMGCRWLSYAIEKQRALASPLNDQRAAGAESESPTVSGRKPS